MGYRTPSRFIKGVSTSVQGSVLGNFMVPNMLDPHIYADDFDKYAAGDWTNVQVGTGTTALVAANGGKLRQTTTNGATDSQSDLKLPGAFCLVPGNQFWYVTNVEVSHIDATLWFGMQPANAAPMVPVDGIFFKKTGASANIDFVIRSATVSTTLSAVTTLTAAVATSFGFYYDGKQDPTLYVFSSTAAIAASWQTAFGQPYFIGGQCIASIGAQSPTSTSLANLPLSTIIMAPGMGLLNTTANARTLTTDYILAATEQLRY